MAPTISAPAQPRESGPMACRPDARDSTRSANPPPTIVTERRSANAVEMRERRGEVVVVESEAAGERATRRIKFRVRVVVYARAPVAMVFRVVVWELVGGWGECVGGEEERGD